MAKELSSQTGVIATSKQLLKRLEQHDYNSQSNVNAQIWRAGIDDWDEIRKGAESVPNGADIMKHYMAARSLVEYGHE